MKKVAYFVGGVVVLLITASLIVPAVMDWNSYKAQIADEVRKATGRTLQIGGALHVSIFPSPNVSASDIRFSNAAGGTADQMATLEAFRASVKLFPLLTGKIEIDIVELQNPVIELEKLADGSGNWVMTPPPVAENKVENKEAANNKESDSTPGFGLALLQIRNGTLVYRDKSAGTIERIRNLNADVSAKSLSGPFSAKGGVSLRDIALTFDMTAGRLAEKGAMPFDVSLGTPHTDAKISLKGNVTDLETVPKVSAKLNGRGNDLASLIGSLSRSPARTFTSKPFEISASVTGSAAAAKIRDLRLSLGESLLTGDVSATLGDSVRADISLRSDKINANELLDSGKGASKPSSTKNAAPPVAAENTASTQKAAPGTNLGLPPDIAVNVDFSVGQIEYKSGRVRDIRLQASLAEGKLTMKSLSAVLPGNSQFSATASATSPKGVLTYAAKTRLQAGSLREVLNWLEVDVNSVPSDRLRRFTLAADISGNPGQVQISNLAGQLDASKLNGGITIALRDRLAFGARISIDQVNADAYLGTTPAKNNPPSGGTASASTSPTGNTSTLGSASRPGPLAPLNDFDANLIFRIGSLSYQRTPIRDVRLDANLVNGVLSLQDVSIRNLAGTSAQVRGTLTGLSGIPAFKGTVAAASNDLTGLFRVAEIKSPVPPRKLGRFRFTSQTDATLDRISLKASLKVAEIDARLSGQIVGPPNEPRVNLHLKSQHPEMARLVALFSDGSPGPQAGKITFNGELSGGMKALGFALKADLAGGNLSVSGRVENPSEQMKLDLGFNLKHLDFVRFARTFKPDFNPSKRQLGELSLVAKLQGTDQNLTIQNLAGNVGPVKIKGTGAYLSRPTRPDVKLFLKSSAIPLSDFLQAPQKRAPSARSRTSANAGSRSTSAPAHGGRWSTDRIDTSALGLVDANIDISADALLYQNYRVDGPKILAVLKNKVLDVRQISGRMYDGTFEMTANLNGQKTPSAAANIKIANANVRDAFFSGAEYDIEAGRLSQDLSLTARGDSQQAMIRSLKGAGKLTVTDGIIRGFDLNQVSEALGDQSFANLAGILGVVSAAFNRDGRTKLSFLTTNLTIKNGIVLKDSNFVSDAADGRATGRINLPNWQMNIPARIVLKKVKGRPSLAITVLGAPDNPDYRFHVESIAQNLLRSGIGNILQNLIPGARKNSGSGGQQQEQQQAPKPADILKGILKGLGR